MPAGPLTANVTWLALVSTRTGYSNVLPGVNRSGGVLVTTADLVPGVNGSSFTASSRLRAGWRTNSAWASGTKWTRRSGCAGSSGLNGCGTPLTAFGTAPLARRPIVTWTVSGASAGCTRMSNDPVTAGRLYESGSAGRLAGGVICGGNDPSRQNRVRPSADSAANPS